MIARAGPPSVHALALAGLAASLLCAAATLPIDAPPLSLMACPLRAATGLPCLSCGFTHAFHFAVRGQLARASAANPLGLALVMAGAVHLAWTALRLFGLPWAPRLSFTHRWRWVAIAALAANWAFVALRGSP